LSDFEVQCDLEDIKTFLFSLIFVGQGFFAVSLQARVFAAFYISISLIFVGQGWGLGANF
jgi:hypothetical protein